VLLAFALGLGGLIELLTALRCPPRVAGAAAAMLAFVLLTTLFWGTQLHRLLGREGGEATVSALAAATPMLATCDSPAADFNWQEHGLMYSRITRLGQDVPLAGHPWWTTALLWSALAAIGWPAAARLLRRKRRG
jgi:hypothetical protein